MAPSFLISCRWGRISAVSWSKWSGRSRSGCPSTSWASASPSTSKWSRWWFSCLFWLRCYRCQPWSLSTQATRPRQLRALTRYLARSASATSAKTRTCVCFRTSTTVTQFTSTVLRVRSWGSWGLLGFRIKRTRTGKISARSRQPIPLRYNSISGILVLCPCWWRRKSTKVFKLQLRSGFSLALVSSHAIWRCMMRSCIRMRSMASVRISSLIMASGPGSKEIKSTVLRDLIRGILLKKPEIHFNRPWIK